MQASTLFHIRYETNKMRNLALLNEVNPDSIFDCFRTNLSNKKGFLGVKLYSLLSMPIIFAGPFAWLAITFWLKLSPDYKLNQEMFYVRLLVLDFFFLIVAAAFYSYCVKKYQVAAQEIFEEMFAGKIYILNDKLLESLSSKVNELKIDFTWLVSVLGVKAPKFLIMVATSFTTGLATYFFSDRGLQFFADENRFRMVISYVSYLVVSVFLILSHPFYASKISSIEHGLYKKVLQNCLVQYSAVFGSDK